MEGAKTLRMARRSTLVIVAGVLAITSSLARPSSGQENARIGVLVFRQELHGLRRGSPKSRRRVSPDKAAETRASDQPVAQEMTVDLGGQRLMLQSVSGDGKSASTPWTDGANRVLLRMDEDPPRIYSFHDTKREFRVYSGDLNKYQEERDLIEDQERRRILGDPSISDTKKQALLSASHLRGDGKRVVEVTRGKTETILGFPCQEIKITENGRTVLHAWVSREIGDGTSFYHLYRRLGTFSRQVLEKLAKIEGVPLRATIQVVTAAPVRTIRVECVEVQDRATVAAKFFDLPPDYAEIEEEPAIVPCPVCSKKVEREQPGGIFSDPGRGQKFYFCSRKCLKEFRKRLRGKPQGGLPGPTESSE